MYRVMAVFEAVDRISGVAAGIGSNVEGAMAKVSRAGASLSGVGRTLTATVTAPLLAIGTVAVKTAADFESQMNILSIAARSSGTALVDLSAASIKVGGDTELVGINAAEAAEAMTNFYKAGLTTSDIMGDLDAYLYEGASLSGALRAAIDLQAASELDLAQASDIVSIAMATFGLDASEAASIADIFVRSADASVASVSELADALVNVGPTAASFGWSLEETNIALALLSQRGIRGAEAGTALKSMMTNLMRPTDSVQDALAALNVELYDAEGQMRSLPDIIGQLSAGMDTLTEAQRHEAVQTLAGTYGMKAMNTLLAEGVGGWDDMVGAVDEAAGAQETAAARTQGLKAAWEMFTGVLQTFMIQVGTPIITEVLTPLVQRLAAVMGRVTELDPKILGLGLVIAGVAAAGGPLLMMLGTLLTLLPVLLSPVGLVVAGLVALGALWATNAGGVRDFVTSLIGRLQPAFETVRGVVETVMLQVQTAVQTALTSMQTFWDTHGSAILTKATTVFDAVRTVITDVLTEVSSVVSTVLTTVQTWWDEHGTQVMTLVETAWGVVQTCITTALEAVTTIVSDTLTTVATWWDENHALIQQTTETVFGFIESKIMAVLDVILLNVETALNAITTWWDEHGTSIMGIVDNAWTIIQTTVDTVINVVLGIIRTVMQLINGDWSGAWETIKGIAETVWANLQTIIGTAANSVQTAVTIAIETLRDLLSPIWDSITTKVTETWGSITTAVTEKVAEVYDAATGKIDEILTWIGEQVERFTSMGSAIIDGLKAGVRAAAGGVIEAAKGVINDAIAAAKRLLGMSSPSKVFIGIGEGISEGLGIGIGNQAEFAINELIGVFDSIDTAAAAEAAEAAESVSTIAGALTSILSGLEALGEYEGITEYAGIVPYIRGLNMLETDLPLVVAGLERIASYIDTEALPATVETTESLDKLFGALSSICGGLGQIGEYEGVTEYAGIVPYIRGLNMLETDVPLVVAGLERIAESVDSEAVAAATERLAGLEDLVGAVDGIPTTLGQMRESLELAHTDAVATQNLASRIWQAIIGALQVLVFVESGEAGAQSGMLVEFGRMVTDTLEGVKLDFMIFYEWLAFEYKGLLGSISLEPEGLSIGMSLAAGLLAALPAVQGAAAQLATAASGAGGGGYIAAPAGGGGVVTMPAPTPAARSQREVHLHVGTLVADQSSLRQLANTLRYYDEQEDARRGV